MDALIRKYQEIEDDFLALGSKGETEAFLKEAKVQEMRANFSKDGPPHVPGKCDVLTTYIPVEHQPLVDFLSETVDTITSLFPDGLPYYLVPPSTHHISLVMIQDFRPVDMGDEEMTASALTEEQVGDVRRIFSDTMVERNPKQYELRFCGIVFSPIDGAMLAVFVDDGQTLELRTQIGDAVKGFLNDKLRKYKKPLIHVTLLRPLAQFPRGLLRALQDKQRELFPMADAGLTLPVSQIALGREWRWMHSEVEDLEEVTLR